MERTSTVVRVVAVALTDPDGTVLMQQRPANKAHGGLWEFPGGKIEAGEGRKFAACREIREELGLQIEQENLEYVGLAKGRPARDGDGSSLVIFLYKCRRWVGEPQCHDAEALAWVTMCDIPSLAMPPLDYSLAQALISSN